MGINCMSLVIFLALNLLVFQLNRCREKTVFTVLKVLWIILLVGNFFRYTYAYPVLVGERHIPIEYSTVAYFLVPIMMLLNIRNSRVWAAIYGLIAGLLYYITMIVASHKLYAEAPPYDVYISFFCHGTLYVNGMIMLMRSKVTDRDWAKTMLCLLIVSVRALLLRKYAIDADELFIYDVLFGDIIRMVLPRQTWFFMIPLYYIALNALIIFSLRGFRRSKKRVEEGKSDLTGGEK